MLREDDMLVQQEAATRKHRAEADAEFWRPQEHTPEWQHTPSRKTRFVMHPLQGFLPLLPKCYSKGYHMAGHATGTFPAPRAASCGGANWRAYGSTHGHPRVIIRSSSTQRLGIDHPDPWLRQYNIRQKALRRPAMLPSPCCLLSCCLHVRAACTLASCCLASCCLAACALAAWHELLLYVV